MPVYAHQVRESRSPLNRRYSYILPKAERDNDRADVAMGAMALYEYRMKWYGETEEKAKAAISEISSTGEVIE